MPSKRSTSLRFNCYLIRPGLTDIESALQPKYRSGAAAALDRIEGSAAAPTGAVSFLGRPSDKVPTWATALNPQFPGLVDVVNRSNRLIVMLPVADRHFALCFGHGAGALEWDAVESNFGLKVASRALGPDQLTELRSRRINASARTQSVQVPGGTTLPELGVAIDGEFVRKLAGKLDDGSLEISGSVVAGDSIAFKSNIDLHEVQSKLEEMLTLASTAAASPQFEFVDALAPLRKGESLSGKLDRKLADEVLNIDGSAAETDVHLLEFAPPDDVSLDLVDSIKVSIGSREAYMDDLTLAELRRILAELGVRPSTAFLQSVKLIAIDANSEPASSLRPLRDWLVFETGSSDVRYILTLGRWFRLEESYTAKLNSDLGAIKDVTTALKLPPTTPDEHEGAYNSRAASGTPDLLLMDKELLATGERTTIEACDLLSRDGHLVCVKRYNGSQTLSHLFAQGTVAAQLLVMDQVTKTAFVAKVRTLDPSFEVVANEAPRRVTYAISIANHRTLPDDLPTFSKVNLRDAAERLRQSRVEPSIAKIEITPASVDLRSLCLKAVSD